MRKIELVSLDLPDFGLPTVEPIVPPAVYQARYDKALRRASAAGYDALVVYGDREHFANLAYLTAYDPRFEEALFIVVPGRDPSLLIGNEGMAYSYICPLPVRRVLYQSFSLLGQPRDSSARLDTILRDSGLEAGMRVGVVGWKYFDSRETDTPVEWIEIPAYIAATLREIGCQISNATALFMSSVDGLRAINEVEQLARFEFTATYSSQGVRDAIFGIRPGMTELEWGRLLGANGMEIAAYSVIMSGERTKLGLQGPSQKVIQRGEPAFINLALWGANTARGGFVVASADELPTEIRDYVDKLVAPYFRAVVEWYEALRIGVTGGELYAIIHKHLSDPFFGVGLNPGHLIHLDEWMHSPVYANSTETLRSGMAVQVDVIPATGTPYFTTNIEDGIALADEALRDAFAAKYPQAWGRIQRRRAFMRDALGIHLQPEVLPFSNIPAYLPPYLLAPHMAMTAER